MNTLHIVRLPPRANVPTQRTRRTNTFASARATRKRLSTKFFDHFFYFMDIILYRVVGLIILACEWALYIDCIVLHFMYRPTCIKVYCVILVLSADAMHTVPDVTSRPLYTDHINRTVNDVSISRRRLSCVCACVSLGSHVTDDDTVNMAAR